MTNNEPTQHYKDLQEMLESPEHKKLERLVRQGCEEGIIDVYPPLPENKERNKKLAEWAGIMWKITERTHNRLEQDIWVYPDGAIKEEPPNFTESLDACFKWLVPLAIKKFGAMAVYFAACEAMYEAIEKKSFSTKEALYDGKPALALSIAIEKLVDKETN